MKRLVGRVRDGVSALFSLPDGYEVVLGNGGATAFWDVATFGLIRERSQHLSFGEFSAKFATAAQQAPFLGDPTVDRSRPRHPARSRAPRPGVDAYAWAHNETSTGVMAPVRRVEGADDDALVLVDATSGAGGLPVDIAEVDAYYFAPQKSFASDGGLWIAVMSPAALERAAQIAAADRWVPAFLDLPTAIDNSPEEPDLQHPVARDAVPDGRAARLAERATAGSTARSSRTTDSASAALHLGREDRRTPRRTSPNPDERSLVIGTIDFDDGVDAARGGPGAARQRDRRRRALPQARPQPAAGRDVPGDRARRTSRRSRPASTMSSERI